MINLLPPEQKRQIIAGQSNTLLLRYCTLSIALTILIFAMAGAIYLVLMNSMRMAENTIASGNEKSLAYQKDETEANEFKKNLATAKAILDKEVTYSLVAVRIANSLPPNIVINSLQLDSSTFGQPVTLEASGKTYSDAISLKTALEKSSYFNNVFLESVSEQSNSSESERPPYPVNISINVTIDPGIAKE